MANLNHDSLEHYTTARRNRFAFDERRARLVFAVPPNVSMLGALEYAHRVRRRRSDYRRHTQPTAPKTTLVALDSACRSRALVHQLTRAVDLRFGAVVRLTRLLRCLLVHLQTEARAVSNLSCSHCCHSARRFLAD